MQVSAGQDGIQRLLAAEQEAQKIVATARKGAPGALGQHNCPRAAESTPAVYHLTVFAFGWPGATKPLTSARSAGLALGRSTHIRSLYAGYLPACSLLSIIGPSLLQWSTSWDCAPLPGSTS